MRKERILKLIIRGGNSVRETPEFQFVLTPVFVVAIISKIPREGVMLFKFEVILKLPKSHLKVT